MPGLFYFKSMCRARWSKTLDVIFVRMRFYAVCSFWMKVSHMFRFTFLVGIIDLLVVQRTDSQMGFDTTHVYVFFVSFNWLHLRHSRYSPPWCAFFYFAQHVVSAFPTHENWFWDLHIIVLSLGIDCIRFLYGCQVFYIFVETLSQWYSVLRRTHYIPWYILDWHDWLM